MKNANTLFTCFIALFFAVGLMLGMSSCEEMVKAQSAVAAAHAQKQATGVGVMGVPAASESPPAETSPPPRAPPPVDGDDRPPIWPPPVGENNDDDDDNDDGDGDGDQPNWGAPLCSQENECEQPEHDDDDDDGGGHSSDSDNNVQCTQNICDQDQHGEE